MRIPMTCGCKVVLYEEDDSWGIEWCNLHASAPDSLEALELLVLYTNDLAPQDIGSGKKTLISSAIGKAKQAIAKTRDT